MTNQPCIGLIVPPAHGRVPADAQTLYGERYRFIARGLGIGSVSPAGFAPVMDDIVAHACALRDAGAQVVSLMGTSISFHQGPEFTDALRDAMRRASGLPCSTMSHGVVAALRELGIRRVAVATSYIDELNRQLQRYLTQLGFEVTAIEGLSIDDVGGANKVSTESLVELSARVLERDRSAQGIFISCGGLLTLDAIRILEARYGLPVTASSPAAFWDVVRLGGWDARSAGAGRLFEGSPA